ncbi:MAG: PorV/PorQ family protein [Elusimicrobiota bacterium]|nr:MAG: PorV/PorQ family protein [Elusimicrobiota bacterium]
MRILALAVLLGLPGAARAAGGRLSGAEFLNFQPDARALGMAESGQGLAAGAGALTTNPAAVAGVRAHEAYFTHSVLGNGIGADHLSYAGAFGVHRLGLAYRHLGYGTLEGRDDAGSVTGGFAPSDTVYALTYGTTAGEKARVAATVKRVESKIVSAARTTAFDIGGQYDLDDDWSLGASGHNLGGGLRFDSETSPLPARAAVGGVWKPAAGWNVAADVVAPLYSPFYAAVGCEYRARLTGEENFVAFRAGLNTKTPDAGRFAGLKAGVGARFGPVEADYAFGPGGDIADSHLFAITYRFGTPSGEKGPRER